MTRKLLGGDWYLILKGEGYYNSVYIFIHHYTNVYENSFYLLKQLLSVLILIVADYAINLSKHGMHFHKAWKKWQKPQDIQSVQRRRARRRIEQWENWGDRIGPNSLSPSEGDSMAATLPEALRMGGGTVFIWKWPPMRHRTWNFRFQMSESRSVVQHSAGVYSKGGTKWSTCQSFGRYS